jgi:isoleucyl-tRNA synthetase
LGTLRNVVAFHLGNARADRLPPPDGPPAGPSLLDRWILSRLEGTRAIVEAALDAGDPRPAGSALREFVDDLSTWYVRRSRTRFWAEGGSPDRRAAHDTLAYALLGLARVLAPLLPFTAEWIHQEVGEHAFARGSDSVHLTAWPGHCGDRDAALEAGMAELRSLVEIGRELRQRAGVKSRIPLAELVVAGPPSPALLALGSEGVALLADELNVKEVRWTPTEDRLELPDARWVVRADARGPQVALPRHPTEALREEGLAREVARRLQQTRKDLGLKLTDRVTVTLAADGPLYRALAARREALARDLLAEPLELVEGSLPEAPDVRAWDVDGLKFSARVARSSA